MTEPARFFTRARKIPILVGRLPDGRPLPGGPYTLVQVMSGASAGLVLSKSTAVWAHLGGLLDLVLAAGVVVGIVWGTGKLPSAGRNPFTWLLDAVALYSTPHQGSVRGRPLRVARPRLVRHRLVVVASQSPVDSPDPVPPVTCPVQPGPPPSAGAPALTGVARLLAGAVTREDAHA